MRTFDAAGLAARMNTSVETARRTMRDWRESPAGKPRVLKGERGPGERGRPPWLVDADSYDAWARRTIAAAVNTNAVAND